MPQCFVLKLVKNISNTNSQSVCVCVQSLAEEREIGASSRMRTRWETRLKTGSYAARCRKRAGRVRLEQRPVYRRTDPGTAGPGGC